VEVPPVIVVVEAPQNGAVEPPEEEQVPAAQQNEVPVFIFERMNSPPVIECEAISDEEIAVFEDLVDGLLPPGFV